MLNSLDLTTPYWFHVIWFVSILVLQEFSRFHVQITPMLERLMNNRKEWNALKEVHEAKMAALDATKKAKDEQVQKAAAAKQGRKICDGSLLQVGCKYCTVTITTHRKRSECTLIPFLCSSCSECSPVKDLHSQLEKLPPCLLHGGPALQLHSLTHSVLVSLCTLSPCFIYRCTELSGVFRYIWQ